jgi:hypothetical protein
MTSTTQGINETAANWTDRDRFLLELSDILLERHDQPWRAQAACQSDDGDHIDLFFPDRGGNQKAAIAKSICDSCPVADDCTAYAHEQRMFRGIWGGESRTGLTAARRDDQN